MFMYQNTCCSLKFATLHILESACKLNSNSYTMGNNNLLHTNFAKRHTQTSWTMIKTQCPQLSMMCRMACQTDGVKFLTAQLCLLTRKFQPCKPTAIESGDCIIQQRPYMTSLVKANESAIKSNVMQHNSLNKLLHKFFLSLNVCALYFHYTSIL